MCKLYPNKIKKKCLKIGRANLLTPQLTGMI